MVQLFILFLCTSSYLFASHSIVFIHLGKNLPDYLSDAVSQARLFNKDCPIYLIANEQALLFPVEREIEELLEAKAICIPAEFLSRESIHEKFLITTRLDRHSRDGFWLYATERFFYLYELMKHFNLSDVFHLEYDNMLYTDVSHLLPTLKKYYEGKMAGTFDNDGRCIAGFLYIPDRKPLKQFLRFVLSKARFPNNDMEFLAQFKSVNEGAYLDHLPITLPSYAADHPLISPYRHKAGEPRLYFNHFDNFQMIFDAAALGQYLGGIDPRNGPSMPGFINEACIFNPSLFQYEWRADVEGRLVPWIVYGNEKYPIANLHIHCKNLRKFHSILVPK